MHILILNQFYPPDLAPTGQVAHDLARCLVGRGHAVTVLTSRRGYTGTGCYPACEVRDGVAIRRLPAPAFGRTRCAPRLLSYGVFYLALLARLALLRPRPDVVVSLTTPPYVGLLARWVGLCRRWRRVHWIMDLYPDAMAAYGMFGRGCVGRWAAAGLRRLTRHELSGAAAVLTLGPDMARRCRAHTADDASVEWVPLWAPDALYSVDDAVGAALRRARGWRDELVLMYSGNLGLGHRFEEFLTAASELAAGHDEPGAAGGGERQSAEPRSADHGRRAAVRFVFAGGGQRRSEVEAFARTHPEAAIEVLDYASYGDLPAHLGSADVLLASQEPAWVGCMVPSKVQGMLAAGRPVIFVGAGDSSAAQWISEADAGWVVRTGDRDGLRAAVAAARDPAERQRRGAAARSYARVHFDRQRNCERIAALVEAAGGGR